MGNDRNVTISCTEEVKDYLGESGYSPAYGARPLGRIIEREVLNRLAVLILRGSIKDGEVANVVMKNGRIVVMPNHDLDNEDNSEDDEDEEMVDESDADDVD